jgi:hypothetical protein
MLASGCRASKFLSVIAFTALFAAAQTPVSFHTGQPLAAYGPFNGVFLQEGAGLTKPLQDHDPLITAQHNWSLTLWLKTADPAATTLLAGVGHPSDTFPRYLALQDGRPTVWSGGAEISGKTALTPGVWHALGLSVDIAGITHLYADGSEVASAKLPLGPASPVLELAPASTPPRPGSQHFGGWLALVTLRTHALDSADVNGLTTPLPGLDNLPFETANPPPAPTLLGKALVN